MTSERIAPLFSMLWVAEIQLYDHSVEFLARRLKSLTVKNYADTIAKPLPIVGNRNFCSFIVSVMMTPKTVNFEKTCSLDKAMACNGASIMQSAGTSIPVFRAIATHMPKPWLLWGSLEYVERDGATMVSSNKLSNVKETCGGRSHMGEESEHGR